MLQLAVFTEQQAMVGSTVQPRLILHILLPRPILLLVLMVLMRLLLHSKPLLMLVPLLSGMPLVLVILMEVLS